MHYFGNNGHHAQRHCISKMYHCPCSSGCAIVSPAPPHPTAIFRFCARNFKSNAAAITNRMVFCRVDTCLAVEGRDEESDVGQHNTHQIWQIGGPTLMRGKHLHIRHKEAARGVEEHCGQAQTGTCARAPRDQYLRHLHDDVGDARQHALRSAITCGRDAARGGEAEREGNGKAN